MMGGEALGQSALDRCFPKITFRGENDGVLMDGWKPVVPLDASGLDQRRHREQGYDCSSTNGLKWGSYGHD